MFTGSDFNSMFDNIDKDSYTSKANFRNFKLTWSIEDFEFVCKTMNFLESPRFPSIESENIKWYIRFEPTELKEGNEDMFYIKLLQTDNVERYVTFRMSILNPSGGQGISFIMPFLNVNKTNTWCYTGSVVYKQMFSENSLPKNVTVTCELSVFDSVKEVIEKPLTDSQESENLLEKIESFFDNEALKDVTFQVKRRKFNAHKVILSLRSPVFAAMFESKMSEPLTSIVEIQDIKPTIFQQLLRFIYTDKVENLKESALELLYAAEKYQLEKLKKMCINSLCTNLSLETVFKSLELAETFYISELKEKCLKFLVFNAEAVEETKEFERLMRSRPYLAKDILNVQKIIKCEDEVGECSRNAIFELRAL